MVKKFELWWPLLRGTSSFFHFQIFAKLHLSLTFTYLKNFVGLALKIKKFEFWRARLGELPIVASPISDGHQYFWIFIIAYSMIHVRFVV